jgi:hypothetical protein
VGHQQGRGFLAEKRLFTAEPGRYNGLPIDGVSSCTGITLTADAETVTYWLHQLQAGDPAAQPLWEHYFVGLVRLARSRLLRAVRLWKLEGYTNAEIDENLGCAAPTLERRLWLIRKSWEKEVPP